MKLSEGFKAIYIWLRNRPFIMIISLFIFIILILLTSGTIIVVLLFIIKGLKSELEHKENVIDYAYDIVTNLEGKIEKLKKELETKGTKIDDPSKTVLKNKISKLEQEMRTVRLIKSNIVNKIGETAKLNGKLIQNIPLNASKRERESIIKNIDDSKSRNNQNLINFWKEKTFDLSKDTKKILINEIMVDILKIKDIKKITDIYNAEIPKLFKLINENL